MASNESRAVLVTGASSGIGRATALLLAGRGDRIAAVARDGARLEALAREIRSKGGIAEAIPCDVTREEQVESAVTRCVEKLGGLDVLVPAAGIIASGTLESTSLADFDHMMAVNVRSVVHTIRCAIPHLARRPGCIVTISSTTGFRAFPNVFSYCVSKAAVEQATRCLALDLAPRAIRVNGICPGVIVSELHRRGGMDEDAYRAFLERAKSSHPLGHAGEVADAAEAIAWLASDAAKWITGALLPVDGGRGVTCLR